MKNMTSSSSDNAKKLADTDLSGIKNRVSLELVIAGKMIGYFKHFKLVQSVKTHHSFELTLAHDSLGENEDHNLERSQEFLGKRITVIFKYKEIPSENGPERIFVGVITKVVFNQEKGSLGNIILKGQSPTVLLDGATHTQSFGGEQSVNTGIIAERVISEGLSRYDYDFRIDPQYKGYIEYSSQYNETHYNYLARLAEAYGEQFYYDGEVLHFGKLPRPNSPIRLIYGVNVNNINIEVNAIHTRPTYFGYNGSNNKRFDSGNYEIRHMRELAQNIYEKNMHIYKTPSLNPSLINANMFKDLVDSQKGAAGSAAVEVFGITGTTSIPFLYPGCIADVEMRKPETHKTSYFTRVMITQVDHEVDARGFYKGSFEAISEGTGYMPKPEFTTPRAESQLATVISNTDALSQGRVQVRFDWQNNSTTHFIRVMSPDAGGTGAVPENRGYLAVPEVGDQVMVGFEYQNPSMPFVLGGMFHSENSVGSGIDNKVKSIQTRSGNRVVFDDNDGSINIKDSSGNSFKMDGQGNIKISAPNKITIIANDIRLHAYNDMDVKVGNDLDFTVGNSASLDANRKISMKTSSMEQQAMNKFKAEGSRISLKANSDMKIEGEKTEIIGSDKLLSHSDEEITINSKGKVKIKGKDGIEQSNQADDKPDSSEETAEEAGETTTGVANEIVESSTEIIEGLDR